MFVNLSKSFIFLITLYNKDFSIKLYIISINIIRTKISLKIVDKIK